MSLGVVCGYIVHEKTSPGFIATFSGNAKLLTKIFLFMVQMIIAPLVFATLVVGIAKLGSLKMVGRVGGKAFIWFLSASFVSLLIGLLLVNFFHPGAAVILSTKEIDQARSASGAMQEFSLDSFVDHVFPKSVIEAMSNNAILQIVVFSIFFGVACASVGEHAKPIIKLLSSISHVILKMVGYVMIFAPFGVFGSVASIIASSGLEVFHFYGKYLLSFILGIVILWAILLVVAYIILRSSATRLLKRLAEPLLVAFSTTSSEAVFPVLTRELEAFGCKEEVVAFILPLGYSFNLDGSMMYMTFASLAIAQIYHVQMNFGTQITMLLVLMLMSKGIAGVPRAALVVVTATIGMFKIPLEGIALLLPVDHFCDMLRSMTNVLGNGLATTVVTKWEGELKHEHAPEFGHHQVQPDVSKSQI